MLKVLCKFFVDFDNLKANGYDLLGTVVTQGWKGYFKRLKGWDCEAILDFG